MKSEGTLVAVEPAITQHVHDRLLRWYEGHGRNLPWRHTRDPYRILVAEFMLQQTQVDRVIPKYEQFLALFPTVEALAAASAADVIRAWRPLGYNRRAIGLQAIARQVRAEFDGEIPSEVAALRRLKGIGAYTAGAIACFAFGQDVAFVDTNIRRVLGRILNGNEDATPKEIDQLAMASLPHGRAYEWHQALMDLGATICTARTPQCGRCPARDVCRWQLNQWAGRPTLPPARVAEAGENYDAEQRPVLKLESPVAKPRRRKASRPEGKFEGSARYYRGRIIAALCEANADGIPLSLLTQHLGFSFGEEDASKLRSLVSALNDEGLVHRIEVDGETVVRLPD